MALDKKRKTLSADDKRKKVEALLRAKDAGRRNYSKADKLLDELLDAGMQAGEKVEVAGGRVAELVDNFARKNKHFKPTGVARFEFDVSYEP